jgi:transposase
MDVLYERCCGIDVHKRMLTVCVLVGAAGAKARKVTQSFPTITQGLIALREWLVRCEVTHVVMESTGVYWKPVYNVLEEVEGLDILLANARNVKNVPGRKTDVKDAEWLAQLLRSGLIERSLVPPKDIRELRDITKMKDNLKRDRTAVKNRIQNVLEQANIKIGSVISDVFGVSGMAMIRLLASGYATSEGLASQAMGSLKRKMEELTKAVEGKFEEHHSFMLRLLLAQLDELETIMAQLDSRIAARLQKYSTQVELLCQLPGVSSTVASIIIAQLGVDMSAFPSDRHVSSWAGVSPGNNESAGKRISGRTQRGNRYLKSALVEAAWAASHTRGTYLSSKYWALRKRRGEKRAILAVAHKILIQAYHVLRDMSAYRELGPEHLSRLSARSVSKLVQTLEAQGFTVTPPQRVENVVA